MWMVCAAAGGKPADVRWNVKDVLGVLNRARHDGARVVVLPQLCLTGIGCGDLFCTSTLIDAALSAAAEIAGATQGLACVFGLPVRTAYGLVSMAAVALDGALVAFAPDTAPVPGPWFVPGKDDGFVQVAGAKVPVTRDPVRCAGMTLAVGFPHDTAFPQADIVAVPGGEPFTAGAAAARARGFARHPGLLAYANASVRESTTDRVYDGHALAMRDGLVLAQGAPFANDAYLLFDTGQASGDPVAPEAPRDPRYPYAPAEGPERSAWCRELTVGAARALATRMQNIGVHSLTLGVSGGLDSAHALLVSVTALDMLGLPRENLVAVSLPAFGSTRRTQDNAARLIAAFGLLPRVIPIGDSVAMHLKDIGHDGATPDAAYENAQARERTQVLMDLANMVGGLMVGPGDLSELALGFTTYGGDHMSMYAVNGGLPKTALRMIFTEYVRAHSGTEAAQALQDILDTPVSPELLPPKDGRMAQRTEDIVGPYDLNDFFLHHFLTDFAAPARLASLAREAFAGQYNRLEIATWMRNFIKRFFQSQFKRSCQPDGAQLLALSVSPRGGLAMPSDAASGLWLEECDHILTRAREGSSCARS